MNKNVISPDMDLADALKSAQRFGIEEERKRVLAVLDEQRLAYRQNTRERQILDFIRKLVENGNQPRQTGLGV